MTPVVSASGQARAARATPHGLDRVLALLVQATLVGITVVGIRSFTLWGQVVDLRGSNPIRLVQDGNPHGFRSLVVWPVFWAARRLGDVDPNTIYTTVAIGCLLLLIHLSATMARTLSRSTYLVETRASLFWLILYVTQLDGRLVLALIGFALILEVQTRALTNDREPASRRDLVRTAIGLLLTGVATGPLIVAAVVAMLFFASAPTIRSQEFGQNRRRMTFAAVIVIALVAPPLIRKNLSFFQGDWTRLLDHGFGVEIAPLLIVVSLGLFMASPLLLSGIDPTRLVIRATVLSVLAGAFGLSGLAMGVVPLSALFAGAGLAGKKNLVGRPPSRPRALGLRPQSAVDANL